MYMKVLSGDLRLDTNRLDTSHS